MIAVVWRLSNTGLAASACSSTRTLPNCSAKCSNHWRARRADGHVINADGSLSPAVHQWDRWAEVLLKWVDSGVLYPKAVSAEEQRFLDQENAQS